MDMYLLLSFASGVAITTLAFILLLSGLNRTRKAGRSVSQGRYLPQVIFCLLSLTG